MESVVDRFLRYVRIDTQSSEDSTTAPTTARQLDLARLLVDELRALDLASVSLSRHGVVMATLPSSLPPERTAATPVVGFLAHLDTSPAVSGANVRPEVITYAGGDVILPGDPSQVIRAAECPELAPWVGRQIITTDGTTLLGADDKAGIAAIMHALDVMRSDRAILHGTLRVGFTPDEEVGRGTDHFDVAAFGAKVAYTMDGGELGEVEGENFCADGALVTVHGHSVHPGTAKDLMVNAVRVAADFIARLPRHRAPEKTAQREPFLHPDRLSGDVETAVLKVLVRAFTLEELAALETTLEEVRRDTLVLHPKARIEIEITEQYRNMRYALERTPLAVAHALAAVARAGVTPRVTVLRGGTDGARLTAMGLPTPNLFAGGINFHSKKEWIAVPALEAASRTVVELAKLWAERPGP